VKALLALPALLLLASTAGCGLPRIDLGRIIPSPPPLPTSVTTEPTQPTTAGGRTAYFLYETPTAPTKQCVYNLGGSPYARTVLSNVVCPLTITVTP